MSEYSFRENVCIITGASSGIGRELALQLAQQGAWLVLSARNEHRLEEVAHACRQLGGKAIVVPADVSREADCKRLVASAVDRYGRIDTLVNNAGISMFARFEEVADMEILERIMAVNFFGSMYCTHYALPHLKQTKGRIVGVSSLTGKNGVPTRTAYAASKHAMAGFFDSLRIELQDSGVSVTMIYPGFVATEVRERAFGADGKPMKKTTAREDKVMTAEACARLIIRAAARRRRELVMTARARIAQWLKLIAPSLVDRIARRAIEKGQ